MAKTKHQKLADLMQAMLNAIEEHRIQTKQLLDSMQLCLLERYSCIDPRMVDAVDEELNLCRIVHVQNLWAAPNQSQLHHMTYFVGSLLTLKIAN